MVGSANPKTGSFTLDLCYPMSPELKISAVYRGSLLRRKEHGRHRAA